MIELRDEIPVNDTPKRWGTLYDTMKWYTHEWYNEMIYPWMIQWDDIPMDNTNDIKYLSIWYNEMIQWDDIPMDETIRYTHG